MFKALGHQTGCDARLGAAAPAQSTLTRTPRGGSADAAGSKRSLRGTVGPVPAGVYAFKMVDYSPAKGRLGRKPCKARAMIFASNVLNSCGVAKVTSNADSICLTRAAYRVRPRILGGSVGPSC